MHNILTYRGEILKSKVVMKETDTGKEEGAEEGRHGQDVTVQSLTSSFFSAKVFINFLLSSQSLQ